MADSAFTVRFVHKSLIRAGDCIVHHGREMTVCKKDITRDEFMGMRIFGDSYMSGHRLVQRMEYNDPKLKQDET